ncbi:MAG: tubulin-like doman-containing protein [Candidatus Merdivicinus sp.]|jgi:hypothetical protein
MAASTLIVGLGGMGWKIVKMVADMTSPAQRKNIKFVVIDTDANELNALKNTSYPGRIIQTSARMTVKAYLHNDEYAKEHWFPVHPLLDNKVVTEGASQVRAISRLAFNTTVRSGGMGPLHDAIDELYRLTGKELDQALRIIVVSSLAGGTGSGILLPVGMYIRNYLLTKYHQSAAIIQGFFILPEVFYQEIDNEAQRDNLRCNAYAALRELDAFLMRADNTLPARYRNLTLEFPRSGKNDWEDYSVLPYDNCFLFDGQNINGAKLNSFKTYMEHAANCIYAQSISVISERSNSAQDNTFRPLVAAKGRNRYCGAGSAILQYPYEDIREYIALRWIQSSMSDHWLDADHILEDKKRQHQQKLDEGYAESDFDDIGEYITAVETSENSFAKAIVSWCEFRNPDNPTEVEDDLWNSYLENLLRYVQDQLEDQQPGLEDDLRTKVSPAIVQGLVDVDLSNPDAQTDESLYRQRVSALLSNLRNYQEEASRSTVPVAEAIAYSVLHSSKNPMREKDTPYLIESFLKRNSQAIPPNAMRYVLCKVSKLIEEQLEHASARVRNSETVWKNFETAFDDPDTGKSRSANEAVQNLTSKRRALFGRRWQINEDVRELISSNFTQFSEATTEYRRQKAAQIVLKAVLDYVNSLIDSFTIFYNALEGQLQGLEERQQVLLASHENDIGYARRLVCCTPHCIESLYQAVPSVGGLSNLPPELSTLIYEKVRDYALQARQQRRVPRVSRQQAADLLQFDELFPRENRSGSRSYFVKIFDEVIMGYWKHLVSLRADSLINMDILDALEKEGELEHGCITPDEKRAYAIQVIEETQRLAAPFIESSYNPDVWTINGCTYSDQLAQKDYEHRRIILDKHLKGAVTDEGGIEQIDQYQIVFYQSVYCIRAMELPKFSAPVPAMGNENGGDYYRAYFELTRQISFDPQQTLVVSPHLNRYWHLPNHLPDLDEENMKQQEQQIMRAFFIGLVLGLFSYDKFSRVNTQRRYAFHLKNAAGDYFPEDLPTPGDLPCTKMYQVYEALLINPPIVDAVNQEYNRIAATEKIDNLAFRQGNLAEKLAKFRLSEREEEWGLNTLSFLDFVLFYKLSLPKSEYEEPQFLLLTETILQVIEEDIRLHTDPADVALYFAEFMQEQLDLFFANLDKLAEKIPGIRDDSLIRIFRGAVTDALSRLGKRIEEASVRKQFEEKFDL